MVDVGVVYKIELEKLDTNGVNQLQDISFIDIYKKLNKIKINNYYSTQNYVIKFGIPLGIGGSLLLMTINPYLALTFIGTYSATLFSSILALENKAEKKADKIVISAYLRNIIKIFEDNRKDNISNGVYTLENLDTIELMSLDVLIEDFNHTLTKFSELKNIYNNIRSKVENKLSKTYGSTLTFKCSVFGIEKKLIYGICSAYELKNDIV